MNKIRMISKLISVLLIYVMNSACTSEDANATTPCPNAVKSAEIIVLDSITGIEIKTAEVVFAGNIYDNTTEEYGNSEVVFNYNVETENYGFEYTLNGIEIEKGSLTIYTFDDSYHANVTKPQDYECTNLKATIHLCPNGSACR